MLQYQTALSRLSTKAQRFCEETLCKGQQASERQITAFLEGRQFDTQLLFWLLQHKYGRDKRCSVAPVIYYLHDALDETLTYQRILEEKEDKTMPIVGDETETKRFVRAPRYKLYLLVHCLESKQQQTLVLKDRDQTQLHVFTALQKHLQKATTEPQPRQHYHMNKAWRLQADNGYYMFDFVEQFLATAGGDGASSEKTLAEHARLILEQVTTGGEAPLPVFRSLYTLFWAIHALLEALRQHQTDKVLLPDGKTYALHRQTALNYAAFLTNQLNIHATYLNATVQFDKLRAKQQLSVYMGRGYDSTISYLSTQSQRMPPRVPEGLLHYAPLQELLVTPDALYEQMMGFLGLPMTHPQTTEFRLHNLVLSRREVHAVVFYWQQRLVQRLRLEQQELQKEEEAEAEAAVTSALTTLSVSWDKARYEKFIVLFSLTSRDEVWQIEKPGQCLQDEMINAFLYLLSVQRDIQAPTEAVSSSYLATLFTTGSEKQRQTRWQRLREKSKLGADTVQLLLPYHIETDDVETDHWILFVADLPQRRITHYDSLGQQNPEAWQHIMQYMEVVMPSITVEEWDRLDQYDETLGPQYNGVDCGVYVLLHAALHCYGLWQSFRYVTERFMLPVFRRLVRTALLQPSVPLRQPLLETLDEAIATDEKQMQVDLLQEASWLFDRVMTARDTTRLVLTTNEEKVLGDKLRALFHHSSQRELLVLQQKLMLLIQEEGDALTIKSLLTVLVTHLHVK